jgi:hypothetical protein
LYITSTVSTLVLVVLDGNVVNLTEDQERVGQLIGAIDTGYQGVGDGIA